MAVETLPLRATLSWENFVTRPGSAVISVTSERSAFKAVNLLSPLRSRTYRSTSGAVVQKVRINVGAPIIPTVFALIDCNLIPGTTVTLRSDTTSAMTAAPIVWTWNVYAQTARRTYRRFIGPADSGAPTYPSGATARQFWELELSANSAPVLYHEVGVWWLGTYLELPIDEGFSRHIVDPSLVFISDGQAAFVDRRPTHQEVEGSSSFMPELEAAVFEAEAERLGSGNHVLLDLWSQRNDDGWRARGCYYAMPATEETLTLDREIELRDNISWGFAETRG